MSDVDMGLRAFVIFVGDAPVWLVAAMGSVIAGYVLARLYMVASAYVRDPASSTVLQFVSTFGVWLLSERLTLSPIITVVVYGMTLAQATSGRLGPRLRISSYSVWETAVFVINVLAFVLMGLQARPIIERLSPDERWGSLAFGLSVLALVILVRIAWLAVYRTVVAVSFSSNSQAPRCRQSVARISLDLNLLKDARWWRRSMPVRSPRMPERCFWARRLAISG